MSEPLRFEIVTPEGLAPYVSGLRALERAITYPVDDGADSFTIDHGPLYHPFFSQMGDQARFMVVSRARDGRVVGSMAGVWREATLGAERLRTLYLGDLKLAPQARGAGVVATMFWRAIRALFAQQELRGWSLIWGAAMRGARGDVTRSMRGAHPARIAAPLATLRLYFTPPQALLALDPDGAPAPPTSRGLDLSPELGAVGAPRVITTFDTKAFRLSSTGAPWPLVHVSCGPAQWREGLAHALMEGARSAATLRPDALCCFALDARLSAHSDWLASRGILPGATCTIHGLPITQRAPGEVRDAAWAHLSTSQI